ncbi:MAG: glycosyltransferase family 1 protein [Patescibacteria group bacterium]|jgi:glycosyltransferase involved in cell wall biosynthesis
MRVSIDCQALAGKQTGFGTYLSQLLPALRHVAGPDDVFQEIRSIVKDLRTPSRMFWDQVRLPLVAMRQRPDVLFVPAFTAPLLWRGKLVVTCHDVIGMIFPQYFSKSAQLYWKTLLPASLRHADHVLTVSTASKRDIVRLVGIPESRITVTPLAAKKVFQPQSNPALLTQVRRTYNLPRPFCLAVGTIEPRKNLPFLIETFATAKRESHDLVIVGKRGWDAPQVDQRIRQLHLGDRVHILEYVAEAEVVQLMAGATALLFPSRYEGFGLPVLEAMASGTPVVASTSSSIPEVAGDAVLYADPSDMDAWRSHIGNVINDSFLRAKLRANGLQRAKQFTWENTAQRTLAVFHTVCKV